MDTSVLAIIVSCLALLNAIILGWSTRNRTAKRDTADDAGKDERLRVTMDYIRQGVDGVQLEIKDQGRRFDQLTERVTRVEESAKQAHHRIDEIRKGDAR